MICLSVSIENVQAQMSWGSRTSLHTHTHTRESAQITDDWAVKKGMMVVNNEWQRNERGPSEWSEHLDINGNWIEMMEINTVAINKWQCSDPQDSLSEIVKQREREILCGSLSSTHWAADSCCCFLCFRLKSR